MPRLHDFVLVRGPPSGNVQGGNNRKMEYQSERKMSRHTAMTTENRDQREGKPEPNSAGEAGGGAVLSATPCSLTAVLTLAFIFAGILSVVLIVGLAVWLPIEIQRDGEIIKERNDLYFKANDPGMARRPNDGGQPESLNESES